MASSKIRRSNHVGDLRVGRWIAHFPICPLHDGEHSRHTASTGSRDVVTGVQTVAAAVGLPRQPLGPWQLFNLAFGKTVPRGGSK